MPSFSRLSRESPTTAMPTRPTSCAIAAAVLLGFIVWRMAGKSQPAPAAPVPVRPTLVAAVAPTPEPAAAPTPAPLDPKAVDAEVQRQLAAKRKELEKAAAGARKVPSKAAVELAASELVAAPAEPPPPTAAPTSRPEPTAVPTEPPPPTEVPRIAFAATEPDT